MERSKKDAMEEDKGKIDINRKEDGGGWWKKDEINDEMEEDKRKI